VNGLAQVFSANRRGQFIEIQIRYDGWLVHTGPFDKKETIDTSFSFIAVTQGYNARLCMVNTVA
jgi:hypothetical protein